jgi:mannose-6-phosphate isomerase-like protein (cupin superfamily)
MKGAGTVNRYQSGGQLHDYGPEPLVVNIDRFAECNPNYRTALWTGGHLQVTLMSIRVGGDIGLEMHPNLDQFLRVQSGCGLVKMGSCKDSLNIQKKVDGNYAIVIPAGTWHNLINIGNRPLKLYSIYAPPEHPFGTIHETKEIAEKAEGHSH